MIILEVGLDYNQYQAVARAPLMIFLDGQVLVNKNPKRQVRPVE
jgi:hypothetical protein